MDSKAGGIIIIALMGAICGASIFFFIRTLRKKDTGIKSALRIARLVVSAVCAVFFGYIFINLLLVIPQLLAS